MSMIEDAELRALFETESEEYLHTLDAGLLHLETNPGDSATLEEVFRAAHSLKGSARMLDVIKVESIAHDLEDELGEARRGRKLLTSEDIDGLCRKVDEMRRQVQVAIGAEAPGEAVRAPVQGVYDNTGNTTADVAGETEIETPLPAVFQGVEVTENETADSRLAVSAPFELVSREDASAEAGIVTPEPPAALANESGSAAARFRIDTIRVPPAKLDTLMTLAGELAVTTTRVSRGLSAFDEITALWEAWTRDLQTGTARGAAQDPVAVRNRERLERLGSLLGKLRASTIEDVSRLRLVADEIEENVRRVRLLPLERIFSLFPRPVRDLARTQGKEIQLVVEGADTEVDKRVLEELKDPLMHMIRNAIDHGIELPAEREMAGKNRLATLRLRALQTAMNVVIELEDDGRGLNTEAIRRVALRRQIVSEEELAAMTRDQVEALIFSPGFSTSPLVTDVSGRGVGLDVVRANVESLKGSIHIYSIPGQGCRMRIVVPLTLATTRVLLIETAGRVFGVPIEFVKNTVSVTEEIISLEGRDTIVLDGEPLSVASLSAFLELPEKRFDQHSAGKTRPCVVLEVGDNQFGVLVDALVDEQEVVLKPLGGVLRRVRHIAGATILGTGDVCHVLNPHDMLRTIQKGGATIMRGERALAAPVRKLVLLVEDSITTRTQEKRILEAAGYEVVTAVDGVDGFNKLSAQAFDAVVSDVEMPNMNGLDLAAKIRLDKRYEELPIILVTSLASEDDKRRGVEVGANAYITKDSFDQKSLLDTLGRLA